MKSKAIALLVTILCAFNIMTSLGPSSVYAAPKLAIGTKPVYAKSGLHAYTIGVQGYYQSNGRINTKYEVVRPIVRTSGPWSSSNSSHYSAWATKSTSVGIAYADAHFILGLSTAWINLGFQSRTDHKSAYARP